jgi:hypothetical protein
MRKKRDLETSEHRDERLTKQARERMAQASADDRAVDAAIRKSIERHGA